MEIKDIEQLATLARIEIGDDEKQALLGEMGQILAFVDAIKAADIEVQAEARTGAVYNVLREDGAPHTSGEHTEALLNEAPAREGNFVKVKNIL